MREGLNKIVCADDTIVAIATPLGRSAIGVIRISGSDALRITQKFFHSNSPIEPRRQVVGSWCEPAGGDPIDEVVIVFAARPHSYSGEDLVEISTHGNPIILKRLLQGICDSGARVAAPGEFTLRAVANGKMDLMQAEAVREFIDAQTEHQARTALRQLEGAGAKKIEPVKRSVVDVIAHLEAGIDFAEDDVEIPDASVMCERLEPVISQLNALLDTFGYGRILSEGLQLAILGKPNVGKSSLFNRLLSLDRAIVTDIPGTTRDVLSETIDLDGIPLRLMDTAGLRQTVDHVEGIGVGKSLEALAAADLALVVLDGSQPADADDEQALQRTAAIPHLVVVNKADLPQTIQLRTNGRQPIYVSARTGTGMDTLRSAIASFLMKRKADSADDFILTNVRQHETVVRAVESLKAASTSFRKGVPHEMVLLDLYSALSALNELTGEVVTEDILDKIFSTFCIGK